MPSDNDSVHGFDRAPARYTQGGREVIDQIRDAMTDGEFLAFCYGNVIKYKRRAGAKGDPEGDANKSRWYWMMAMHVLHPDDRPDPRHERPDFKPYVRQA